MAFNKKYAGLPDLDLAPDIYETPELTDAATLPTTTVRSSSPFDPEQSLNPEIDGRRLRVDEARSHFEPVRVDARDVDFSDSIASKKKSYRTIRGPGRQNRVELVLGDLSDEEDETLERKLARLRRETEELKEELATRKAQREAAEDTEEVDASDDHDEGILELSRTLDTLYTSSKGAGPTAEAALSHKLSTDVHDGQRSLGQGTISGDGSSTPQPGPNSSILSQAASFDARLTLLEAALGLKNTPVPVSPDDPSDMDIQPILPSLNHLSSQLSTLSSTLTANHNQSTHANQQSGPLSVTTTPHIEALSSKIRKLTADAEALTTARQRATDAARAAFSARIAAATSDEPQPFMDPTLSTSAAVESDAAASEQTAKIHALYTTLPTITSLHPLLPSVLERLRSLRAIHAGAATASQDLDALEQHQADMKKEIDQWKEGLKAMEEKVKESEETMKGNMEVMGPWVKDLEKRLDTLNQ
ncbi:hypothetical protein MGYG_01658 [Nannizzia gypsea CBS 118893]|uniref:Dynactin subunit 2 n=1 Tax=Arthroderma gypseum (strain ATCC MYA-4604 / CBS 118893) TaxID=535722 RepID=E5R272_ARTGP|nr:hypothetical protein MGYG_01658 [Nannizzia gypsea CBS 118893]EFQ98636.1 hypothetical protein MGYG_01658 [Nannizzia gypsea CBS 118893]